MILLVHLCDLRHEFVLDENRTHEIYKVCNVWKRKNMCLQKTLLLHFLEQTFVTRSAPPLPSSILFAVVFRNYFHFSFPEVFFHTVVSVNAKVYPAKFRQKLAIRKSWIFKLSDFFYSRKFLPAKVPSLKIIGTLLKYRFLQRMRLINEW